jgi:hypothetical protein
MRLILVASFTIAAVWMVAGVKQAQAHPLPKGTNITIGLHKICKTILICRDKAPQPRLNCWWGNRGTTEEIYDPTLDALVTWRCSCPDGEYGHCRWVRVSIRPMPADYLKPPNRRHVWDWQRKCASLVCIGFRVDHFYRSIRYYPTRLAEEAAAT